MEYTEQQIQEAVDFSLDLLHKESEADVRELHSSIVRKLMEEGIEIVFDDSVVNSHSFDIINAISHEMGSDEAYKTARNILVYELYYDMKSKNESSVTLGRIVKTPLEDGFKIDLNYRI